MASRAALLQQSSDQYLSYYCQSDSPKSSSAISRSPGQWFPERQSPAALRQCPSCHRQKDSPKSPSTISRSPKQLYPGLQFASRHPVNTRAAIVRATLQGAPLRSAALRRSGIPSGNFQQLSDPCPGCYRQSVSPKSSSAVSRSPIQRYPERQFSNSSPTNTRVVIVRATLQRALPATSRSPAQWFPERPLSTSSPVNIRPAIVKATLQRAPLR